MLPAPEHAGPLGRQEALLAEEGDELGSEEFFHCVHAVLRQDQEAFIAQEESVSHEQVQVGMEVEVLTERMNGHDDAGHAIGLVQGDPHDISDALMRNAA